MWYSSLFGGLPLPTNLTAKKLARYENDSEFLNTFMTLLNLVTSIFKWKGLPDTCDAQSLEASLIFRGCACIVPYGGGVTNMGAAPGGGFNVHRQYTQFWAYGWNGYTEQYRNYIPGAEDVPDLLESPGGVQTPRQETGIFIRDNYYMHPYINTLILYSRRLAETMRRIDTTSYNLVWPGLFTVDDGQVNTVKKILADHDDNVPVVIGRKALDDIGMQKVDFGITPDSLQTLWNHYDRLMARLMEFFGIDSNPVQAKAERVNTLEVSSNDVRIELARDNRLHCRRLACDALRDLWGLDVSVDYDETIVERAADTAGQLADAAGRIPGSGSEEDNE